jgi:hypothetical protein
MDTQSSPKLMDREKAAMRLKCYCPRTYMS